MKALLLALSAQAKEKIAFAGDNFLISSNLEHILRYARTHFSKNQQVRTDVKWKNEDNLTQNKPRRLPAKG